MGFNTRFLGRLDIEPKLSAAEVEWLTAYAELDRRYFTDPYEVPMNPTPSAWRGNGNQKEGDYGLTKTRVYQPNASRSRR